MKIKSLFLVLTFFLFFEACEIFHAEPEVNSIIDTQWKLIQVVDLGSGSESDFPSEIDDFKIVFRKNGKIELPDYCNYSYGSFELGGVDSIRVFNVGEGTEKYCYPDLAMDWESLFINSLVSAETYTLEKNRLDLKCRENKLIFDYIGACDPAKGKVLFCTNAHIINCPFEIEISINGEIADTLDASDIYSGSDCVCENSAGIGLLMNLDEGAYNYSARLVRCMADNITGSWSGSLSVTADSCTVVYFDITGG